MTILELEQRTGLDRSAIRYYEKEGLIAPARKENSYRDYSEENATEILKIKLLRQLDVSVEQIRRLQQGSEEMSQVLRNRAMELSDEAYYTDRAANICKEISESAQTYAQLDAAIYLEKLNETRQAQGTKRGAEWNLYPYEFHPIKRFVARLLDYALVNILLDFLIIVVLRIRPVSDFLSNVITYGSLILSVPLQAFFLNRFATTPGKWLLGIRIVSVDGHHLSYGDAVTREWKALCYGHGFGIPFLSLYRHWKSYKEYKDRQILRQDEGIEHLYDAYEPVSKKALFAGVCAVLVALNVFSGLDIMKPRYRGDLTVAQFARNYNYYSYIINEETGIFTANLPMNPDGTWFQSDTEENANTIIISTAKAPSVNYAYGMEGERVSSISYSNTWTEVQYWTMPKHLVIASVTAIMSQKNMGFSDLTKMLKQIDEEMRDDKGEITRDNITIRWKIEAVGCIGSNGTYFAKEEVEQSSLKLHFEIIIQ